MQVEGHRVAPWCPLLLGFLLVLQSGAVSILLYKGYHRQLLWGYGLNMGILHLNYPGEKYRNQKSKGP